MVPIIQRCSSLSSIRMLKRYFCRGSKLKWIFSCIRRITFGCRLFRTISIILLTGTASNNFCRNLKWFTNMWFQSRTGWWWSSSAINMRYSFSGFSIVYILIEDNSTCLCLRLKTSIIFTYWLFKNRFFS